MYRPCIPKIWDNEESYLVENECFVSDMGNATTFEKLRKIKAWLGQPDLLLVYNVETLVMNKYGKEAIK